MTQAKLQLDWFDPTILSPGFFNPVINAVADVDAPYLRTQLDRHLFRVYELPGEAMYDRHGFGMTLAKAFDLSDTALQDGPSGVPDLEGILAARAARRVAVLLLQADRVIEADVQRFAALLGAVESSAARLRTQEPPTQLLMFLAGPAPSFRPVDPAAKRRAEQHEAVKVMAADVQAAPWSAPRDFDLVAHHRLIFSHAEWHYLSRGRRAAPGERWHGYEEGDTLTFVRAADARPCLAGTFARTAEGMQLVGLRYEGDEAVLRLAAISEDAFTLFRALCESVVAG